MIDRVASLFADFGGVQRCLQKWTRGRHRAKTGAVRPGGTSVVQTTRSIWEQRLAS